MHSFLDRVAVPSIALVSLSLFLAGTASAMPVPALTVDASSSSSSQTSVQPLIVDPRPGVCGKALIVDNGDCGHRLVGAWAAANHVGTYNADQVMAHGRAWNDYSGPIDSRSIWKFEGVDPGVYNVYVHWSVNERERASAATNAPFTVRDGVRKIRTVRVNQRLGTTGTGGGRYWHRLGSFTFTRGFAHVNLRNFGNGAVYADAVKIEKLRW